MTLFKLEAFMIRKPRTTELNVDYSRSYEKDQLYYIEKMFLDI